ncbi:MAG TPA: RimK family alpha-L-glutamate ligase [Candidatus Polarisedimenticolaceae bacterium]|nr:RimK family alpha-L-glutamate ligase [Candidatus Polarisedimenticolaceae bacterium]
MRLLILSRRATLYSTRRLLEAAASLGHEGVVVDPLECWLVCGRREPALYYGASRRKVAGFDVVLPRIGSSITDYGLAVVNQFDMLGVPVVNMAYAIGRSRDKLRSLQFLSRHDIDIPRTVMARGPGHLKTALETVGGLPVVLKLIQGTQGIGVMLAETEEALESILHTLWHLGHNILIQEFIGESRGRDIRALVVGDRVVAAMKRTARVGDFRSNLHRGGSGSALRLPRAYERAALESVRIMGLHVAGVDMLESRSGPKVIEINSSPGFEGMENATGVDVARAMVEYATTYAASRAVPVRQVR